MEIFKFDKGLQNALVIDNDDLPISYHTSNIDNHFELSPDLNALFEIFKNNPDDIFKYNTDKCLTFILRDGKEIPLNKLNKHKPVFLKISNDILKATDNEILIACNGRHFIKYGKYWAAKDGITDNALDYQSMDDYQINDILTNDFNGFEHTCNIAQHIWYESDNIFRYALGLQVKTNKLYYGYVPAAGQLLIIMKYIDLINYIFKILQRADLSEIAQYSWTSNEISSHLVAISAFKTIHFAGKNSPDMHILPLFKSGKIAKKYHEMVK